MEDWVGQSPANRSPGLGEAPHLNAFGLGAHGRMRANVWTYPGTNSFKCGRRLALHPTVKPVPRTRCATAR